MPFEMLSGSLLATAAVPTQIVMNGGDSRVVRNFDLSKKCFITDFYVAPVVASNVSILKSPKFHDNVLGFHTTKGMLSDGAFPLRFGQQVFPQDTLELLTEDTLAAGEWDNFIIQLYYEDLPNSNGNFVTFDSLKGKIKNILTVNINATPGGAVGYQTGKPLDAVTDLLKGNTKYALLGYQGSGDQVAAGIRGPMTGNLRVCLPSYNLQNIYQGSYFVNKSTDLGYPMIPILDSADKSGTFVDFLETTTGSLNSVDLIFGEIS